MEKLLKNGRLGKLLERGDEDLARACQEEGCSRCGDVLHSAKYRRQPRGPKWVEAWEWRDSFCCARDGCRKRHTPPSLRFLGRRVYAGIVVVLVAAMMHGLKPHRVERLRQTLGIDEKTLKRWRSWWLEAFAQSGFWKEAKGRFMPPADEGSMPLSLVKAFEAERSKGMVKLLEFLAPITVPELKEAAGM